MSHEIVLPYDQVLSTKGPEWHGLATVLEEINSAVLKERGLFFPISSSETLTFESDGEETVQAALQGVLDKCVQQGATKKQIESALSAFASRLHSVSSHRTIVANLSECRPDLVESGHDLILPLHIPRKSYGIITNEQAFNAVSRALPDFKIVTAGTLRENKLFFVSVDIGDALASGPRGDSFSQYLDIVTSHDGTHATSFFNSTVRIVCANTVRAALEAKGGLDAVVYHTKNAQANLDKVSVDLTHVFQARQEFFSTLEHLNTVSIDKERAAYLAAAFLSSWNIQDASDFPTEISTQTYNKAEEIQHLFQRGKGNLGANLYDFYNAVTECYTSGTGTGKNRNSQEKFLASLDGTPNEIKQNVLGFLSRESAILDAEAARGEKLFKDKAATL